MSFRRNALVALATVAVAASAARADLTAEVNNGDKIASSISPAAEVETFTVTVPANALLTVKGKGKGKGPAVAITVRQPDDAVVPGVVEKGGAASLKKFECPLSGVYTVTVTSRDGVTTGDYGLKISWKTPTKVREEPTIPGDPAVIPFTADAGAQVSVKAVAGKGSAVVPFVSRITGPGDFVQNFGGVGKAASDKTDKITVPTSGDYTVVVADNGGAGGSVKVQVKVKPPKVGKQKIDVRSKRTGAPNGDEFVVAQILGTDGGTVGVPALSMGGPDTSIAGSAVQIPGGALALPTAVIVGTATPVETKKGNEVASGPSVFFGPEGQKFGSDVTVTIPMDTESFEGDFSELQVFTRDARGKVKLVPGPYTVNEADGTVSFPTRHFSSFAAFKQGADTGGNEAFSGTWRLTPDLAPGVRFYLEIFATGKVNIFSVDDNEEVCFFGEDDIPAGTDLTEFFDLDSGDLVFPGAQERYVAVPANQLPDPQDCIPTSQ